MGPVGLEPTTYRFGTEYKIWTYYLSLRYVLPIKLIQHEPGALTNWAKGPYGTVVGLEPISSVLETDILPIELSPHRLHRGPHTSLTEHQCHAFSICVCLLPIKHYQYWYRGHGYFTPWRRLANSHGLRYSRPSPPSGNLYFSYLLYSTAIKDSNPVSQRVRLGVLPIKLSHGYITDY